jgi:CRISPR/Cas system CSM-associated protein Csm2 small subunit
MRKKELRMRVNYETNRLAKTYSSGVYEMLIPIIKRLHNSDQEEKNVQEKERNIKIGGL